MLIHLPVLFMYGIACCYSQMSTINKACGAGGSTCGVGQVCVNSKCECDPAQRRFWAGEKYQCRVCPPNYYRQSNRCYKFYSVLKNYSEARADCRKDQADLFSWRDNSDANELITAAIAQWSTDSRSIIYQFYAWSGGTVNQGRDTIANYTITWSDPKGPTMHHPLFKDPFSDRYCNPFLMENYKGDPEPTRGTKTGETEDCVSFVFFPQPYSRGEICLADDYCSTKMTYICELTEATMPEFDQSLTTADTVTNTPVYEFFYDVGPTNLNGGAAMPSALGEDEESEQSSNILFYAIGGILFLVMIVGIVAFIIIRKRKRKQISDTEVSPVDSTANSNISYADMYNDA